MNKVDQEYFRLLDTILTKGRRKTNRTGVDTIGVFGEQAKFEVDMDAFPILTTKKVWFKGIATELLWFLRGDTNIKYLVDRNVHIWDEWAFAKYRKLVDLKVATDVMNPQLNPRPMTQDEFAERIKQSPEFAEKWGDLGLGTYGGMWRDFPHFKKTYDAGNCGGIGDEYEADGVDQIAKVIKQLETNPDDRRMIVSAWHPYWVDHCALPPCHCLFHFNSEVLTLEERLAIFGAGWDLDSAMLDWQTNNVDPHAGLDWHYIPRRRLNLLLYQRSLDLPLGGPFNITSYSLLLAMFAKHVNMQPGTFTWSTGDTHIYVNQLDGVKEQLKREPRALPKLRFNFRGKPWNDLEWDAFELKDYNPHPKIEFPVAV